MCIQCLGHFSPLIISYLETDSSSLFSCDTSLIIPVYFLLPNQPLSFAASSNHKISLSNHSKKPQDSMWHAILETIVNGDFY
jgi:hypothetical protein